MAIKAKNLSYSYGKTVALENLSFEIEEGEMIAVLGPNGAGKTTLLKCVLGLLKANGMISVLGKDPRKDKKLLKLISYVPQKSSLSTDLPLKVSEVLKMACEEIDLEILKQLELEGKLELLFRDLSGGFQQRVLIARALMKKPKVLLLDEPFNGVDVVSQKKIVEVLKESEATTLVVVHNINPVLHAVHRVMLLNKKLIAFGKANEVFTTENIVMAYGTEIPLVVCEEGVKHPLYGDQHG
ncbi:MAG: metal ABC transporter ATP-binding protein [Archaeoglobaceae archaeon]